MFVKQEAFADSAAAEPLQAEGVCPSSPKVCLGSGLAFDTGGLSLSKSGSIHEPRNERETLKSPPVCR